MSSQTSSAIDYVTSNPLSNMYLNLVIVDEDLELKTDTGLAPPIDIKTDNTG